MKNKGNIWNEVLNIPSAQDHSTFHSDDDAKHKYISNSDDDQKGNKKQGKKQGKQGQKRKAKTKDVASEDNVKKTKQGRGKGRDETSTCVQPSSAPSSSQAVQEQGTSTPTSSQAIQGQGISTPTSSQLEQGQGTSTPTSSQAVQGQTGQSSPYGPQVPDAYEAEIFNVVF